MAVLNATTKREQGKKAQLGNIAAAKVRFRFMKSYRIKSAHINVGCDQSIDAQAVADIIRTTLGPRSMLKMLLDANGGTTP